MTSHVPPLSRRNDSLVALSSSGTPMRSSQDVVMNEIDPQEKNRLRDGLSVPVTALQPRQRSLVLPDPLTFRQASLFFLFTLSCGFFVLCLGGRSRPVFLEEDPCVTVVERRCALTGYELYMVEQWACSRRSPIIVVTTYTGDEKHSIVVGVLAIPEDQAHWSARLRLYFNAARQHNARPKRTELGELMITNLSSFPSALTVIPVPDGDVRKNRLLFIVNEDLKRLGCSGRSGLALTDPTEATQAKFHQLYKTSDGIPIRQSVTELIKLCQVALYMFDKLDHQYIDGLLCDVTERAIGNWWIEVGAEHYNFEPSDGILGPCTVSALLGMLLGVRNRLHWFGAPVSKDVFEIEATKRGVAYFQKQQKLEKTRRLDRQTLFRLHTATAKGASGEGWGVQRAVKSTVSEIGGKRGEIVMDMVSGKDKGGLADIETVDIDRFVSMAYGDRPRWLWHGKARRTANDEFGGVQDLSSMLLGKTDSASHTPKGAHSLASDEELPGARKREDASAGPPSTSLTGSANNLSDTSGGEKDAVRRGVFKSVTGRMSDARSGLGRIKDAVGGNRRGHLGKLSIPVKEDATDVGHGPLNNAISSNAVPNGAMLGRAFTWKNKPEEYLAAIQRGEDVLPEQNVEAQHSGPPAQLPRLDSKSGHDDELLAGQEAEKSESNSMRIIGSQVRGQIMNHKGTSSTGPSATDDSDLRGPLLEQEQKSGNRALAIARRRSYGTTEFGFIDHIPNESRWPRRMSFGDAEEAIFTWEEVVDDITDTADYLTCMEAHAGAANHLNHLIQDIVTRVGPWARDKVQCVELLNDGYGRDKTELQNLHQRLDEGCQRARYKSEELLSEQRESMTESVKEIEVLVARLDYEIHGLVQKVGDVEEGIRGFESQVEDVECRAAELKVTLETESWPHWLVRTLTGVGTGPNVTREAS
ncbi:hypothetical protein E4U13_005504 [Claviceps humidiphila]|uniref:STB6-like N-terminal domain-containing protein n=1 Tax=Claviceps humidiphila TaxID=1294629 RepID=A0A9P7U0G4_9HYPO|nr:hypothetical protein E4U13_005504 [Claviceps humidiphila]